MTKSFFNLNTVQDNDVIPGNTILKVRMDIKLGGYNDLEIGWNGNYVTKNQKSGACYLDCAFTVLTVGKYQGRKVFDKIGLHSDNSEQYENMGRKFMKDAMRSHYGLERKDKSPEAEAKLNLTNGFADLDALVFVVLIETEEQNGELRNRIRKPITKEHKDYEEIMGITSWANPKSW
jgi:hypothetical protein